MDIKQLIKEKQEENRKMSERQMFTQTKSTGNLIKDLQNGIVSENALGFAKKTKLLATLDKGLPIDDDGLPFDADEDVAPRFRKPKNQISQLPQPSNYVGLSESDVRAIIREENEVLYDKIRESILQDLTQNKTLLKEGFNKMTEVVFQPYTETLMEKMISEKIKKFLKPRV